MINVAVFSSDALLSRMLHSEIKSLGREFSVTVNECGDTKGIIILDLDSMFVDKELESDYIIGFSRNETSVSRDLLNKCRTVLHRPFLIETLKRTVLDCYSIIVAEMPAFNEQDLYAPEKHTVMQPKLRLEASYSSVYVDGRRLHLSHNEFAVLELLQKNIGEPVSRDELNSVLSSFGGNMCDVYICHLRSKLEESRSERLIFTVRGKGYMLKI